MKPEDLEVVKRLVLLRGAPSNLLDGVTSHGEALGRLAKWLDSTEGRIHDKVQIEERAKKHRSELRFIEWALRRKLPTATKKLLRNAKKYILGGTAGARILAKIRELEDNFISQGTYRRLHARSE